MPDDNEVSAAARYGTLEGDRQGPLDRARRNSKLTLPWVVPPDAADDQTALYDPWQNVGSQGVQNLSSKMTLAVMPPNDPFFRHDPDPIALAEAEETEPGTAMDAVEKLSKYDRTVMSRIEASGDRPKAELVMKHLLIAGNVLVDVRKETIRVIPMTNYVVVRDPRGKVLELVMKERVHRNALPEGVELQEKDKDTDYHDLFTHVALQDRMYHGFQEIGGERIAGSDFSKKPEDLPFIALRFAVVDGTNYGRSFVENLVGDLSSYETLTQAITDAASMASKVIFLVRPNGDTKVRVVADANNGDFVSGSANDITTLQLDKGPDLNIARQLHAEMGERLKEQFLMRSGVARDAERVTAEEIRYVALELDEALSGIYSLLAHEFQLPYVRLKIRSMKNLPAIPEDVVNVTITTGLEALKRARELEKLLRWAKALQEVFGPEAVARMVKPQPMAKRLAGGLGLDVGDLLIDPEEAQQAETQNNLTEAAKNAAPQLVKGAMDGNQ